MSEAAPRLSYCCSVFSRTCYDPAARALFFLAAVRYVGDEAWSGYDLAEWHHLGIVPVSSDDPRLLGAPSTLDRHGRIIYVRAGLPRHVRDWLVLHELGHWDARGLELSWCEEEAYANVYAGALWRELYGASSSLPAR